MLEAIVFQNAIVPHFQKTDRVATMLSPGHPDAANNPSKACRKASSPSGVCSSFQHMKNTIQTNQRSTEKADLPLGTQHRNMARSHGRVPTHCVLLLLPDDLRARKIKTKNQKHDPTYCVCDMQNRHIASLRSTWGSGTIDPQDRDRCFAFVWVLFVLEPRVRSLYARTGMYSRYSIMCMNANLFACPSIIHLSALVFKFWDW